MLTDQFNFEVTTDKQDAIKAVNHFQIALVSFDPEIINVFDAAEDFQCCILLQIYCAAIFMWNQTEQDSSDAKVYLERIDNLLEPANDREKLLAQAVLLGLSLDFTRAIEIYEALGERYPNDPVIIKFLEFHCFETGDSERQLIFMRKTAKNSNISHVLAMYAFACELNHDYETAEKVALQCIEMDRNTPWAFHCLAHVYFNIGQTERAIELLDQSADVWDRCNVYIQGHLAFHRAIFYFCSNRLEDAIKLFDEKVWGENPDSVLQHTDALLLLWCADIAGVDVNDRWLSVLPHIKDKAMQTVFPFLNAFYVYALIRAGEIDFAEQVIEHVSKFARQQTGGKQRVWTRLGVPLIKGVAAFAQRDFKAAALALEGLWMESEFGGSDEQRIPLMWTYLQSLFELGETTKLQQAVHQYLDGREPSVIEKRWLETLT